MTNLLEKAREGCDGRHPGDEGWHETAAYCMYEPAHQRTAMKIAEVVEPLVEALEAIVLCESIYRVNRAERAEEAVEHCQELARNVLTALRRPQDG